MIRLQVTCYKYVLLFEWKFNTLFMGKTIITVNAKISCIIGMGTALQVFGTRFPPLYECGHASFASVCPA